MIIIIALFAAVFSSFLLSLAVGGGYYFYNEDSEEELEDEESTDSTTTTTTTDDKPKVCVMSDWGEYTNCKEGKRSRTRTIKTSGESCDYPLEESGDCLLENIVPVLKSTNDGGYKVTSSTPQRFNHWWHWKAFRGKPAENHGWHTAEKKETTIAEGKTFKGEWLQIELPKSEVLESYELVPRRGLNNRMPQKYAVLGSNDGVVWKIIKEVTGSSDKKQVISVDRMGPFKFFRLAVEMTRGEVNITSWTLKKSVSVEKFSNLNGEPISYHPDSFYTRNIKGHPMIRDNDAEKVIIQKSFRAVGVDEKPIFESPLVKKVMEEAIEKAVENITEEFSNLDGNPMLYDPRSYYTKNFKAKFKGDEIKKDIIEGIKEGFSSLEGKPELVYDPRSSYTKNFKARFGSEKAAKQAVEKAVEKVVEKVIEEFTNLEGKPKISYDPRSYFTKKIKATFGVEGFSL